MAILLLAEIARGALGDATAKTLTAALALGGPIHVLVAGDNVEAASQAAACLAGVDKVLVASGGAYAHGLAEPLAALIVSLAPAYDAIVGPATSTGKNVLPRVAALLDVMQISEITKVVAPDTFERPIYAGNAIQTVQSTDSKKVITIRTAAFAATGDGGSAAIEAISAASDPGLSSFKGEALAARDPPRPWQPVDLNIQQGTALREATHQLLALQRPVGLHPDAVRRGESKVAVSRQEGVLDLLLFTDAALQHVTRDQSFGKVEPAARAVATGQVQ